MKITFAIFGIKRGDIVHCVALRYIVSRI